MNIIKEVQDKAVRLGIRPDIALTAVAVILKYRLNGETLSDAKKEIEIIMQCCTNEAKTVKKANPLSTALLEQSSIDVLDATSLQVLKLMCLEVLPRRCDFIAIGNIIEETREIKARFGIELLLFIFQRLFETEIAKFLKFKS